MKLESLNPTVYSVRMYERVARKEECAAYDCRLIYVVSGDLAVSAGGENLGHLGAGSLLFIPAGTPYKLRGQWVQMAVVSFDLYGEGVASGAVLSSELDRSMLPDIDVTPFDRVHLLSDMTSEREELVRMCHIYTAAEGSYLAELSARLKLILLKLAEAADEHALPSRMATALGDYIRENIGDEISNTEVAATFGYHPFYISNVLKSAKGQTLRQYIISYRLKLAKSMLECTGKSVAEIAEECGFTDASYFTKTFRQSFGETPKDYRNRFKDEFI